MGVDWESSEEEVALDPKEEASVRETERDFFFDEPKKGGRKLIIIFMAFSFRERDGEGRKGGRGVKEAEGKWG